MRKITIGMVATVMGNVRNDIPVSLKLTEEFEKNIDDAFFANAPFKTVEVIIEYGETENSLFHLGRIINKEILPVTATLKMEEVIKMNEEELYLKFKGTLLHTLLKIGKKYKLNTNSIANQLNLISNVKNIKFE